LTKIIFGINVPYQSTEIDWEATDKLRKERGTFYYGDYVRAPCIKHKDLSFELCGYCGNQITGGRLSRGLRSCSPACNKKLGGAWAHHTEMKEREQKGKRPMFFWWKIRSECFERDEYKCRGCGTDITEHIKRGFKPPEAHHIIPISKGGSNQVDNLKTLCYDCHKLEHSHVGNVKKKHKCLVVE
jgi:5-methylcytosine-specific restriction endonuclease McrA